MKRRTLLKSLGASALALAATLGAPKLAAPAFAAPAYAKGIRRLKMVTTWPKNFPGLGTAPENIAKRISTMSDGTLEIKIFAAGELVGAFEAFDAVSTGTADMYNGAEYYWQGKSPAFNFFTTIPFGMIATEQNAWIDFGGGQELWNELSAKFNIRAFQSANTGIQMGGWYNREINTIEDFRGLKIRMPGLGGEVLRRIGAVAVSLPGGEIFPAMKSGAIDASEWVGPWNDLAFGFHQLGKYYYCPGFQEPGATISTGINLDVWNELTPAHRTMIRTACQAENTRTHSAFNYENARALQVLRDKHKVEIRRFSPAIIRALKQKSQETLEEIAANDAFTAKVYAHYKAAQDSLMKWGDIAEEPFLKWRRDS